MSSSSNTIVHIGLGNAPPNSEYTDQQVQDLVSKGASQARDTGYEVDLTFVMGKEIMRDAAAVLASFETKIEQIQPRAVIFGGGIKLAPQFNEFFEAVVNLVRVKIPQAKMGFQGRPDDIPEVCERLFK